MPDLHLIVAQVVDSKRHVLVGFLMVVLVLVVVLLVAVVAVVPPVVVVPRTFGPLCSRPRLPFVGRLATHRAVHPICTHCDPVWQLVAAQEVYSVHKAGLVVPETLLLTVVTVLSVMVVVPLVAAFIASFWRVACSFLAGVPSRVMGVVLVTGTQPAVQPFCLHM